MSLNLVKDSTENGNDVAELKAIVNSQITTLHNVVAALNHLSFSLETVDQGGAAVITGMLGEEVSRVVSELDSSMVM